jgi:hypothetical protein
MKWAAKRKFLLNLRRLMVDEFVYLGKVGNAPQPVLPFS